jgi:hypothetical protein
MTAKAPIIDRNQFLGAATASGGTYAPTIFTFPAAGEVCLSVWWTAFDTTSNSGAGGYNVIWVKSTGSGTPTVTGAAVTQIPKQNDTNYASVTVAFGFGTQTVTFTFTNTGNTNAADVLLDVTSTYTS